jgi:cobalt/nickel transport system permease protein
MHIPDGYLSPLVSVGLGGATAPMWVMASSRARRVLDNRTIPLLALFAALTFTIMMFNIPVPGGTTAHGVGGTLVAIVLGPWAAVIAVSVALVIQALFFGDGGILAIFANCLNMAVILPFVGYATYRVLAGGAAVTSGRRAWAAGIAGYVALTVAALAVGTELGIQPLLFTRDGHALYSPYALGQAIPAMLVAHLFGASIVEGLITGLGVAWLQQRHPELLVVGRSAAVAGDDGGERGVAAPPAPGRARAWAAVTVVAAVAVLAVVGLGAGGGDPGRMFGADWSAVSWPDVATMLLVVALIGLLLVPLVHAALPADLKRTGTLFTLVAVIAPLGLIAPGFAYGEGSAEDVQAAFGYVPEGLRQASTLFSAPLGEYNLPLPFFDGASAPLWHAALGYEITGIVGILLVGAGTLLLGRAIAGRARGGGAARAAPGGSPP